MSVSCPTCHHIRPTGKRCGSPALRGEQFCFFHHPTRRPPTRTATRRSFDVPPISDPENLQITLSEIIRRLADNTLDTKRAGLLLITIQMAKANLSAIPAYPLQESSTRQAPQRPRGGPDFSDLSGLLSVLGPHLTANTPEH